MPYKSGELKGQLTAPELRRMIKEHNKLMSIKIPPKTDRDGLIKLITDNGYKVNHEAQKLVPSVKMKRKPTIKLPPAPTPKTAEEKADAKKQKKMKEEKKEEEAFESRKKKIEAVKKVKGMKATEKSKPIEKPETLEDMQSLVLKYIRDHKAWLEPTRMSGAKNGYDYYLKQFKKDKDSVNKLDMIVFNIETKIEDFKKGTGAIVNPFKKGGEVKKPLPMPKESYELYDKIKHLKKKLK